MSELISVLINGVMIVALLLFCWLLFVKVVGSDD